MGKKRPDVVYVCIFLENTNDEAGNVIFAACRTLQRAKTSCSEFWEKLNNVYPMETPTPEVWEAAYKDEQTYYTDNSGKFYIEKWEIT